ncbi:hypothetical protein QJS10_CPB17g00856 [Acorus calamus]|uniref:Uncharacterized protein n=1 Tax=Acorus calamus TaxID=4465 RepID=A0AAV9CVU5_ACOCL|nr:hypothetical protein QJS10_CPB17g00856 [Acorus calamus]
MMLVDATIIRVDSENKYGNLLEVAQLLTDLNFIVKKGYMTSDGGCFMNGIVNINFIITYIN